MTSVFRLVERAHYHKQLDGVESISDLSVAGDWTGEGQMLSDVVYFPGRMNIHQCYIWIGNGVHGAVQRAC